MAEDRAEHPQLGQDALVRNLLLGAALTVVTLAVLLGLTWSPDSLRLLREIRIQTVGAALGLVACTWAIHGGRAWLVTRSLGYPVRYRLALRATLVGGMVSGLTPFSGGGGAAETAVLAQGGVPYSIGAAAVTAAGVINQSVLVIVSLVLAFSPSSLPGLPVVRTVLRWILVVYAAGLGGVIAALFRLEWLAGPVEALLGHLGRVFPGAASRARALRLKTRHFLVSMAEALRAVLQRRPLVAAAVAASYLVSYILLFLVAPLLASSLSGDLPAKALVAAQFPLILLGGVLPTPGASGGIEAAMAAVVAPHLPTGAVGIFVSAWRLLTFYPPLVAGALAAALILRPPARMRLSHAEERSASGSSAREPV